MLITSNVQAANGGGSMFSNIITQGDWYINASTGSDSNDGSSSFPLASWRGLLGRWGGNPLLKPAIASYGGTNARRVKVFVQTDLLDSDPVTINATLGQDAVLVIEGTVTSTVGTGTLTTVNASVPASNTAWNYADSAVTNTFWAGKEGSRIRITSGARLNTTFWVAKDLGTKAFRSSDPSIPPNLGSNAARSWLIVGTCSQQTVTVNDPYAIETLAKITLGSVNLAVEGDSSTTASAPALLFSSLWVRDSSAFDTLSKIKAECHVLFQDCKIDPGVGRIIAGSYIAFQGCHLKNGIFGPLLCGVAVDISSGLFGQNGYTGAGLTGTTGETRIILGQDVMFQSCNLKGVGINICSAQIWDSASNAQSTGNAIDVGVTSSNTANKDLTFYSGAIVLGSAGLGGTIRLYGSGNAGVGVGVSPGNRFITCAVDPTLTGSGGDFSCDNQTNLRAFDESTGALTTTRTATWAHLAATVAGGGFASNAHYMPSDAHVLKVS